ncbi:hypothetical protein EZ428_20450 [Pedobacter frigiditerrae]|uniref:Outer membrane protein beta-barrel domain-containing protein n=1 Tax=Pedobacter frigiditerrae TaxID=2530452 RepID=A0A4R0MQ20_9SPHI|nr:hypothetical protein [Pedobacter frigiditerrae]TCC88094.1 hypothetical protein EZ428_20450 [Pedobacter frigiditerrae]
MIKKILSTLLIVAPCCVITGFAQTKQATKDTTKTVIIFNNGSSSIPKKSYSAGNNIVKIDPIGFIFGKIPISYERRLSDLFSVQLSAGITSKNYLRSVWEEGSTEPAGSNYTYDDAAPSGFEDETDGLYNFDHRTASLGYTIGLQPRVYISEEALEGSFFGLGLNMARFNFSTPGLVKGSSGNTLTGSAKNEYENIKDVTVYFGWQRLYDRLSLEYSTGIGLRKVDGVKYRAGGSNGSFYESLSSYSKKTGVNFEISFKLGFQL